MSTAEDLYELMRHVRPLHQYAAKAVADALTERQVTMPMRAVLERLVDTGPQAVPHIARSLWLPRQVVQRIVDDAAALDLVTFAANPAHRRSRLVETTDAGRAAFAEIHAEELANLENLADRLAPEDIVAAVRVVSALTTHMRELAQARADDHGWSTPGPRPGEEIR